MTDVLHLEEWIVKSGKKKEYLAEKCGVTRQTFYLKCSGKSEFNATQIKILCKELDIKRQSDINAVFFAQEV